MALADILNRIETDADTEAAAIIEEARREAERLVSQAKEDAARMRERVAEEASAQGERERETALANARLQARDRTVSARHELVDRVLRHAETAVAELADDRYASLIGARIAAVARGGESVRIADADGERLAQTLPKAVQAAASESGRTVDVQFDGSVTDIPAGVLLVGDRMSVEISPRALVNERREELRALVAARLFGESE